MNAPLLPPEMQVLNREQLPPDAQEIYDRAVNQAAIAKRGWTVTDIHEVSTLDSQKQGY